MHFASTGLIFMNALWTNGSQKGMLTGISENFIMNARNRILDLGFLIDDKLLLFLGQALNVLQIFVGICQRSDVGKEDKSQDGVHDVVSDGADDKNLSDGAIVTHLVKKVHNYFVTRCYKSDL